MAVKASVPPVEIEEAVGVIAIETRVGEGEVGV
jgi:hypothetical protein